MKEITREAFDAWRFHPVTEAVFGELKRRRQEVLEALGNGATLALDSAEFTHALTAKAVSQRQTLDEVLALRYEDLFPTVEAQETTT